jgi:hypothetical protein
MIEDDDTRLIFLNEDDFAEPATVTPETGDPFTIIGIFDARQVGDRALKGAQVGYEDGAQVTGNHPQFRCRETDAAPVKPGRSKVTIRGREYNVFSNKPDSTGFSILILKVA